MCGDMYLFTRIVGRDVSPGSSKATEASVPEGILNTGTFRFAGLLNKGKLMLGMMIDGWIKPGMRAFKAATIEHSDSSVVHTFSTCMPRNTNQQDYK
jgi:hypothetical protein